jgi:hypothetical protein
MTVRSDLDSVIRRELGEAERLLQNGDAHRALRELQSAIRKLKDIERKVNRLEIASRK